ncbi:MAG: hypothetical protein IEMM0008_0097 [bacterium]|nr:MAG: hypothetical protein IEMM0008_0097 [bacterium]
MAKRLSIYIAILASVVFIIITSVYYHQSKKIFLKEINSQGQLISNENKRSIDRILSSLRSISYAIYHNQDVVSFLKGETRKKLGIESRLLSLQNQITSIQAIRILDLDGNIQIFIKQGFNLSGKKDYQLISVKHKSFFMKTQKAKKGEYILSNFERGALPGKTQLCPSMIRISIPYYSNSKKIGYLIVNFWGNCIGTCMNTFNKDEKAYSFLTEFNSIDKERDGIFVFHKEKKYEFANQFDTKYRLSNIYGKSAEAYLRTHESGVYEIPDTHNILFFSTISPYGRSNQIWKTCVVVSYDYIYQDIKALQKSCFLIMFIAIILSIITGFAFSRQFVKPFKVIKDSLSRYGKGDLDYDFNISGDREVKEIARNIKNMAISLKQYIQELTVSRKKLETLDRISSLSILSAGLSHQLNTPLNSIILVSKMLQDDMDNGHHEDISIIKEQAIRCVNIIDNLKSIHLMRNPNTGCCEFNLKEAVIQLKPLFELSTRKADLHYGLEDCTLFGNQMHFEQILLNLVLNALDACNEHGRVEITIKREDDFVLVKIKDNGSGIAEDDLPVIFDPFYTTKPPDKGTGLGLSIVNNLVKRYNGQIHFDSTLEIGTTVTLRFMDKVYESATY